MHNARRDPGKTVGQHPAGQKLAKLPRDELGQPGTVGPVGGGAQEVTQVLPYDSMEHARLRVAWLIASLRTGHAPA